MLNKIVLVLHSNSKYNLSPVQQSTGSNQFWEPFKINLYKTVLTVM